MGFGSIPVAILPSCPDMKTIALKTIYVGSKNKKHLRGSIQATYSPRQLNDSCPTGFGQYNSLGEYCIPHTASSVFLMLILSRTGIAAITVEEGDSATITCDRLDSSDKYIRQSWFRGVQSDGCLPPTDVWLFTQLSCGDLKRHEACPDMSAKDENGTFAMTIGQARLEDDGRFTCRQVFQNGSWWRRYTTLDVYSK